MHRIKPFLLMVLVVFTGVKTTGIAEMQSDRCPTIVQTALEQIDQVCTSVGRNQLCYGNTLVEAWDFDGQSLPLEVSGDMVDLDTVNELTTYPLNVDDDTWGVAVMSVQADLPDISPGQNVTFIIFGNTQIEALGSVELTQEATAPSNINLRTGPGTGYATAGLLEAGSTATLIARNEAGDWARIANEDNLPIWIFAPLLEFDGSIDFLPVVDVEEEVIAGYNAPMQAFRFTSGIGRPECEEAPQDGVVIQTPTGLTANFLINGVQMSVGSTALVRLTEDDDLRVATLDGDVVVSSNGIQAELPVGDGAIITGEETEEIDRLGYAVEEVQGLQEVVNRLPEPFEIPTEPLAGDWDMSYLNVGTFSCLAESRFTQRVMTSETYIIREFTTENGQITQFSPMNIETPFTSPDGGTTWSATQDCSIPNCTWTFTINETAPTRIEGFAVLQDGCPYESDFVMTYVGPSSDDE